jgi:hypothetical protein
VFINRRVCEFNPHPRYSFLVIRVSWWLLGSVGGLLGPVGGAIGGLLGLLAGYQGYRRLVETSGDQPGGYYKPPRRYGKKEQVAGRLTRELGWGDLRVGVCVGVGACVWVFVCVCEYAGK